MSHPALIYSTFDDLTLGDVKSASYPLFMDESRLQVTQDFCTKHSIQYAAAGDAAYHFKFSLIYTAPYIMTWMGNIDLLNHHILSIVGPRKASNYGAQVINTLFESLPQYDIVTMSGLADGVDMMAHDASLLRGIPTIAVLGGGIGHFLTSDKRDKIRQILDAGGLVLSEFKIHSKPTHYTFPQRNRIVAGLADAIFLPEAGEKSGSLITADFGIHMHKPVYGTPNTIFSSTSDGLHRMIQQGLIKPVFALPTMLDAHFGKHIYTGSASDTTKNSSSDRPSTRSYDDCTERQKIIIHTITQSGQSSLLDMTQAIAIDTTELLGELSMLEILGYIYDTGSGVYAVK